MVDKDESCSLRRGGVSGDAETCGKMGLLDVPDDNENDHNHNHNHTLCSVIWVKERTKLAVCVCVCLK